MHEDWSFWDEYNERNSDDAKPKRVNVQNKTPKPSNCVICAATKPRFKIGDKVYVKPCCKNCSKKTGTITNIGVNTATVLIEGDTSVLIEVQLSKLISC